MTHKYTISHNLKIPANDILNTEQWKDPKSYEFYIGNNKLIFNIYIDETQNHLSTLLEFCNTDYIHKWNYIYI